MRLWLLIAALLLIATITGVRAQDRLVLEGAFMQGGLVRGTTEPDARLSLDGHPVAVASDGRFILGFARDASEEARLEAVFADGRTLSRDIAVTPRRYDIQRIEGLPEKMVRPDPDLLARIKKEGAQVRAARATDSKALFFETPLQWPASGPISGVYGSQRILNGEPHAPHLGTDIAAPIGTPVRAAAGGTVTLAEPDLYLTGGTVIIDHGYGLSTTYLHLSKLSVSTGQAVAQGELIGAVGATGRATGPHLHWGINWYQMHLDPELVAGPMPK